MKNQENKKSKKKVLLYYLILAACLLVITAVTLTVVFAVRAKNNKLTAENPPQTQIPDDNKPNNPDDNNPGNTDTPNEPNKPSNTTTEFILPVQTADVSIGYEFRYDKTLDRYAVHKGMDFAGTAGDTVCAVLDGTVTQVVYHSTPQAVLYGGYVTLTHENGMTTTYRFIDVKDGIKVGDKINRGDTIGTISKATGVEMMEGDHLHFEIAVNGKNADPDTYLDVIKK